MPKLLPQVVPAFMPKLLPHVVPAFILNLLVGFRFTRLVRRFLDEITMQRATLQRLCSNLAGRKFFEYSANPGLSSFS
jgi:hypothetical protein